MRLDKFLKVSRLIKRRTVAKEVTDMGRVWVNGRIAKASTSVKEGDELVVQFGQRKLTVRIDRVADTARKEQSNEMYTILHQEVLNPTDSNQD